MKVYLPQRPLTWLLLSIFLTTACPVTAADLDCSKLLSIHESPLIQIDLIPNQLALNISELPRLQQNIFSGDQLLLSQTIESLRASNSEFNAIQLLLGRLARKARVSRNDSAEALEIKTQLGATMHLYIEYVTQKLESYVRNLSEHDRRVFVNIIALAGLFEADSSAPPLRPRLRDRFFPPKEDFSGSLNWSFAFQEFVKVQFRRRGIPFPMEENSSVIPLLKIYAEEIERTVRDGQNKNFEMTSSTLRSLAAGSTTLAAPATIQENGAVALFDIVQKQFKSRRQALASTDGQIRRKSELLNQLENLLHKRVSQLKADIAFRYRIVVALQAFHSTTVIEDANNLRAMEALTLDVATAYQAYENSKAQLLTTEVMLNQQLPAFRQLLDAIIAHREASALRAN